MARKDLEQRVQWAREVGWRVTSTSDGFRMWPDDGADPIDVHLNAPDGNAYRSLDRVMAERGYLAARIRQDHRDEQARLAALAEDRARNDARTTDLLTRATGPYAPAAWSGEDLLRPHPAPYTTTMDIGPVLAAKVLDQNYPRNRPPWKSTTTQYSLDMAAGRWLLTHQGIAFATDGKLLDGQQRMLAVVDSGATVPMRVTVGIDAATFAVMDTGRPRGAADAVAMAGYDHHKTLAAAARLLFMYDADRIHDRKTRVTNQQVLNTLDANPRMAEAIPAGLRMARTALVPARVGITFAYLVLVRTARLDMADAFIDAVCTGTNQPAGSPVLAVHRYFLVTVRGTRHGPDDDLAVLLKGWRAYCLGRTSTSLTLRANERYPSLFHPEPLTGPSDGGSK